jgi:YopX protein
MKREIKFRAWDTRTRGMIFPTHISQLNLAELIPMQFTGLEDKQGKQIYEGDLVGTNRSALKVVWVKDAAGYRARSVHGVEYFLTRELEVIGNIYENPELLK